MYSIYFIAKYIYWYEFSHRISNLRITNILLLEFSIVPRFLLLLRMESVIGLLLVRSAMRFLRCRCVMRYTFTFREKLKNVVFAISVYCVATIQDVHGILSIAVCR